MKLIEFCHTLDCTGLYDPVPLIKAKLFLDKLYSGAVLKLISNDAGTVSDIECWTKQNGARLIAMKESKSIFTFYIEKN